MEPKIVSGEEKTVIGKGIRTTNENGRSAQEQPQLWQAFFNANFLTNIPSLSEPGVILGVYTDYEKDETKPFTYLIGMEVPAESDTPEGLTRVVLPASRYAVFTSAQGPVEKVVSETWRQIWNWSRESGIRRAFKGDFEVYSMTSSPENAVVKIYIGIVD